MCGLENPRCGFAFPICGFGKPRCGFTFPICGSGKPRSGFAFPICGSGKPRCGFAFPLCGFGFHTCEIRGPNLGIARGTRRLRKHSQAGSAPWLQSFCLCLPAPAQHTLRMQRRPDQLIGQRRHGNPACPPQPVKHRDQIPVKAWTVIFCFHSRNSIPPVRRRKYVQIRRPLTGPARQISRHPAAACPSPERGMRVAAGPVAASLRLPRRSCSEGGSRRCP